MLEPAVALVSFAAWLAVTAAVGGFGAAGATDGDTLAAMLCLSAAIALSWVAPEIALGVAVLGGLVALSSSAPVLLGDAVGAYAVLVIAAFAITLRSGAVVRWLTFVACLLTGPAGAIYLLRARDVATQLKLPGVGVFDAGQLLSPASALLLVPALSAGVIVAWAAAVWLRRSLPPRIAGGVVPDGESYSMPPGARDGDFATSRFSPAEWLMRSPGVNWRARVERGANGTLDELFGIGDGVDYDGPALFRRLPPRAVLVDIIVAAAFLTICLLSAGGDLVTVVVSILLSVGLAVRRMSPLTAVALCWAGAIVQVVAGTQPFVADLAILGVLYGMAAYGNRLTRWTGLASAFVGSAVAGTYLTLSGVERVGYVSASNPDVKLTLQAGLLFVGFFVLFGFCWVLGLLVRSRRMARAGVRARLLSEFDRQRANELVVIEQERTRIARDMHDVVAHSLAVVIAQADGTRYAHSAEPAIVDESLKTISATARAALGDVRQLLAELRDGDTGGPQPGIADLGQLIGQLTAAGLPVRFDERGSPLNLSKGSQIAFYRIVQEALTNALRHGDTSQPVTVSCRWEDGGVELEVINRLRRGSAHDTGELKQQGDGEGPGARIGHGLPGMRERAALAGGRFQSSSDGESFAVRAFLPRLPIDLVGGR
jgi:signal transduction histidine kinase